MNNDHMSNLLRRLDNRYAVERTGMSMSTWVETNTRLKKRPFSFKGYEFQRQIMDDLHPNMSVIKISQVGLTEVQVRKALAFVTRNNGTNLIFTFPNEKMYKKNSQTRIQPVIADNPVFNPEGSDDWVRRMDLIQVDQSFLFVSGATEGEATSTPADVIFNDEIDLTDQNMLALFSSRMQNSSWRINQKFSTPSHVGFGIDKYYEPSDQHEYLCKCSGCNHWNAPRFSREFISIKGLPDDIEKLEYIDDKTVPKLDLFNAYVRCEKCGSPLDLDNVELRAWVARYPDRSRDSRGYRITPFVNSRLDVGYIVNELLKYKSNNYQRGWFNTVLGEAWTDGNSRLSEADIRANLRSGGDLSVSRSDQLLLGIDVGNICHVTIGRWRNVGGLEVIKILTILATDIVEWVSDFCANNNVIGGAMDRHPFTPTAIAVWEASGKKVYPVEYRGSKAIYAIKNEYGLVTHYQADRTTILDNVVGLLRKKQLPISGYANQDGVLVEQLRDMIREETPGEEAKWIKLTGNDHYFHALAFLNFSARIYFLEVNNNDADSREMSAVSVVDMGSVKGLSGALNSNTWGVLG